MNSTNGQHESNELLKQILNVNEETLTLQRLQFKLFEEEVKGLKKQMGRTDKKIESIDRKVDGIEQKMVKVEQKMSSIEEILLQNAKALQGLHNNFHKMFDYVQTNHSKLEERLKRVEDKVFLS